MTNEKNKTVTLTLEEATKLTTFLLPIILKSASQIDFAKGNLIANKRYYRALKKAYNRLRNNRTINAAILLLLPKLLFKDLKMLDNCHKLVYEEEIEVFIFHTRKKVEDYVELAKETIINFYKVLLKEFNLMKFYEYCMEIGGNKINRNSFKPVDSRKTDKINTFLLRTRDILFMYDDWAFEVYRHYHDNREFRDISPIILYVSFYYWIKITNSLLKQYKEVMDNEELKQKINLRVFTHSSVILMILCLGRIIDTILIILEEHYSGWGLEIKLTNTTKFESLLVKTNEIFNKFYSIVFKRKEEDINLLIANDEEYPYIDDCIHIDALDHYFKWPIKNFDEYTSWCFDADKDDEDYEEAKRNLIISENICSLGREIEAEIYENL